VNQSVVNLRVERFDAEAVRRNWRWLGPLLAPAVRIAGRKVEDVRGAILNGSMGLASLHAPRGAGLIVLQPGMFDGVFACWIAYVALRVKEGPKEWLRVIREGVNYFEDRARESGCTEMRIGGRNWSRILPGYEPFELGWRKIL
jgi:hypothetical protein